MTARDAPNVLAFCAAVLAIILLAAVTGGSALLQALSLSGIMIIAGVYCRLAATGAEDVRVRAGWNWLMLSMFAFSLHHLIRLHDAGQFGTTPSLITMVAAYGCCLFGLACAVRVPRGMLARLLLDTCVVLAGATVIMVALLQGASIPVSGADLSDALLYRPLVDLAILTLILIALASIPRSARLFSPLVRGVSVMLLLFGGHLWASIALLRGGEIPTTVLLFYAGAGIMMAVAAHAYSRTRLYAPDDEPAELEPHDPLTHSFWFHMGNAVVPYTIAMSAATLLFTRAVMAPGGAFDNGVHLAGSLAFFGVGGLRQLLSQIENRTLYRHMSDLNRDLEGLVDRRTSELVRRNNELEAVHKVAMVSAVSLDLSSILQSVAEQLTHVTGASQCVIHERVRDGARIVARYERGGPPSTARLLAQAKNLLQVPRDEFEPAGFRSSTLRRWELDSDAEAASILDAHGASVALIVPLIARDQTVGIAEIYRTSPEPFSESEVSLAEAVTTQAALATENARAFGKARFAASHDPVTGLLNHRALHEELRRLFDKSLVTGNLLSVVMMDLNLFKEFNDRFGHQAGDSVLTDIGQAIKSSMPSSAITARYGGDEFTVLVPDFPLENVQIFVSSIRERIVEIQERYGFTEKGFGIAVGIASFPADGSNLNGLVSLADDRMYQDKRRMKGLADRRRSRRSVLSGESATLGAPVNPEL